MNVYGEISRLCERLGIEEFGVTTAEPFESIRELLLKTDIDFCHTDINLRTIPRLTMDSANSIICLLFPYQPPSPGDSDGFDTAAIKGKIVSGDVWLGEDYHVYVMRKLKALCLELQKSLDCDCIPFCDTGPLVDKEIAVRCGICAYGRNGLALSGKYGSFFYIGYIITNLIIEEAVNKDTNSLLGFCEGCGNCVASCPTGALSLNRQFDYKKCVSYISQKKGELTSEETQSLGNALYGCMDCQTACPQNAQIKFVKYVDLSFDISNREFKRKHGNTAAGFLGNKRFIRNSHAVFENNKRG